MTVSRQLMVMTLVALMCVPSVYAAPNSERRVRAFAALPDWTGFWAWDGWQEDHLSGEPPGGIIGPTLARSKLAGRPPFKAQSDAKGGSTTDSKAAATPPASSQACMFGFPVEMESPLTFELMVAPEETVILFESLDLRHIYTDGRGHPAKDDLWPTKSGDSIGHWDGETLVVDTVARIAGPIGFLAPPTSVLSDHAHFRERIRMVSRDKLEDQLTIEDPAFTRPWTMTIGYRRVTGVDRFISYDCENDRNPIVNGKFTIRPP
ncbi:MAG: hypothetical protein ACREUT_09650 [Steroidobacteraceae bacterium]